MLQKVFIAPLGSALLFLAAASPVRCQQEETYELAYATWSRHVRGMDWRLPESQIGRHLGVTVFKGIYDSFCGWRGFGHGPDVDWLSPKDREALSEARPFGLCPVNTWRQAERVQDSARLEDPGFKRIYFGPRQIFGLSANDESPAMGAYPSATLLAVPDGGSMDLREYACLAVACRTRLFLVVCTSREFQGRGAPLSRLAGTVCLMHRTTDMLAGRGRPSEYWKSLLRNDPRMLDLLGDFMTVHRFDDAPPDDVSLDEASCYPDALCQLAGVVRGYMEDGTTTAAGHTLERREEGIVSLCEGASVTLPRHGFICLEDQKSKLLGGVFGDFVIIVDFEADQIYQIDLRTR